MFIIYTVVKNVWLINGNHKLSLKYQLVENKWNDSSLMTDYLFSETETSQW